ncbi:MAG: hypothetical protein ACOX88_08520 [Christensenellales bacterium]|jgi:hypothetical protein
MKMKASRKELARMIVFWFVLVSLVVSAFFSLINMIQAPVERIAGEPFQKIRGDYTLMLFQCLVACIIIFLPSLIEKRFKIAIPNYMHIVFVLFLYCSVYLGEVQDFYYTVPHWDSILHAFSGVMLGALGFSLVDLLNANKRVRLALSPFFEALFAFCFAVTLGTLWEIYEFAFDGVLGMNMQKFLLADGTPLIGRQALTDTMKDLIIDMAASLAVCIAGYIGLKARKKKYESLLRQGILPMENIEVPQMDGRQVNPDLSDPSDEPVIGVTREP